MLIWGSKEGDWIEREHMSLDLDLSQRWELGQGQVSSESLGLDPRERQWWGLGKP